MNTSEYNGTQPLNLPAHNMNLPFGGPPTMSSLAISEVVNSRHDHVKRSIQRLADRGTIQLPPLEEVKNHLGQSVEVYLVAERDSYIVAAQLSPEFTAKLVDYWQTHKNKKQQLLPDFADPVAAARAWANEREARQVAERTKAEIGSRREATAMNTASQAVKKANALELELDRAKAYATVKRMTALYHGQPFNWRLLKQTSTEMGIPSIDIFDANYGTVKAYHADVWREAYALSIPDGGEGA